MATTLERDLSGGLTPAHELFFAERPADPEMRESTSIWLFNEDGAFAFPRIGIEGEAHSWDDRMYQVNIALPGGRVLLDHGRGPVPSPIGTDGRPTTFGAGPLRFALIEPFRRWRVTYDGKVAEGSVADQIAGRAFSDKTVPARFDVELVMETPGWVQDYSPEKVAAMSKTDAEDATSMGIGWRIEHQFRATGTFTLDGTTYEVNATGNRIKRQSVRPLMQFRGHVWQAALFPDGRAFGTITYPPAADGRTYNEGYVFIDGRFHPARAVASPWLRRLVADDDASLALEYEGGTVRIAGTTAFETFRIHNAEMAGGRFNLEQTGARYTWDGQTACGMLERSSVDAAMEG